MEASWGGEPPKVVEVAATLDEEAEPISIVKISVKIWKSLKIYGFLKLKIFYSNASLEVNDSQMN